MPDPNRNDGNIQGRDRRSSSASVRAFPWEQVLQFAFGALRLPPSAVWTMTPRELAYAIGWRRSEAAQTLTQNRLAELMDAFPDNPESSSAGVSDSSDSAPVNHTGPYRVGTRPTHGDTT